MSEDPQLRQLEIALYQHLEQCKIPLTRDDWAGFCRELDKLKVREFFFDDWIIGERMRFARLTKTGLFQDRINDAFILALHQLRVLGPKAKVYDTEVVNWMTDKFMKSILDESRHEERRKRKAKKARDLKPKAPSVMKNWLEPMPIFHEGDPCGYVQATGQRRKVIEVLLRRIRSKPETTLTQKQRGKPARLYGFETNCRVLKQWLGEWCDQGPEQKKEIILREADQLAEIVAKANSPVDEKRLARLRQIFITQAKSATKKSPTNCSFDFLASSSACRKKFPPPVPVGASHFVELMACMARFIPPK